MANNELRAAYALALRKEHIGAVKNLEHFRSGKSCDVRHGEHGKRYGGQNRGFKRIVELIEYGQP